VRLDNVWAHYDGTLALEDVNLSVLRGDFLGIIGPNGGGKSTLLKVILGLVTPSRGKVLVDNAPPSKNRRTAGYVPQMRNYDWAFPISVWEVVSMGRYSKHGILRYFNKDDSAAVERALDKVGMLPFKHRQVGALSGGQQQRAFIARALVGAPKLMLLDEAMSGVDATTRTEFYEMLNELRKDTTIIIVSHDMSVVSAYADKIACLNRRLYYHGSKEIPPEDLEATYGCPVAMIAHGIPHRVLQEHNHP
jgi:zinc transport system ATP-binding protein